MAQLCVFFNETLITTKVTTKSQDKCFLYLFWLNHYTYNIHTIVCKTFVYVPDEKRHKLDDKVWHLVKHPKHGNCSRDVEFVEKFHDDHREQKTPHSKSSQDIPGQDNFVTIYGNQKVYLAVNSSMKNGLERMLLLRIFKSCLLKGESKAFRIKTNWIAQSKKTRRIVFTSRCLG